MKKQDFKKLTEKELKVKLIELKKELMKINIQISSGTTPKSPGQVKIIKKTIARILTQLNGGKLKIND